MFAYILPPPPNLTFAIACVSLKVMNLKIILFRFALIPLAMEGHSFDGPLVVGLGHFFWHDFRCSRSPIFP